MQQILDSSIIALRILMPLYAIVIVYQCFAAMRRTQRPEKPLITLWNKKVGEKIPILFWENSIGRSKGSDICLHDPSASRDHCVLMRREDGWLITDTDSKTGTFVNGKEVVGRKKVFVDDEITIGSQDYTLLRGDEYEEEIEHSWYFGKAKDKPAMKPYKLLILVTVFHLMMAVSGSFSFEAANFEPILVFGVFSVLSWVFYAVSINVFKRKCFELETLGLFLSGIGVMLLIKQEEGLKIAFVQMGACFIGLVLFFVLVKFMQDPDRINKWRNLIIIGAAGLLAYNVILGVNKFGQANWVDLGFITIQPSEFVKIAYILIGAGSLDQLQTKKNFFTFLGFTGFCIGALALMGDFGSALIFFCTFMMLAFMRSGDFRTLILSGAGAGLGGFIVLTLKPYALDRFKIWGHVWEDTQGDGYQQVRTLTYIASGGLFGVGVGNGALKYLGASETDLVFGLVAEEMGIILAIAIALAIVWLLFYSRAIATRSRSTIYSLSAVCAAGLLVVQMSLNIFGSTDILPLTGVTLPFISSGGSSMISVWGLLAFIKAADERTYR